jgi:hypothetical protein
MSLRLHIDRLVIDSFPLPPGGGPALQAAVEAELSRLLAEGGLAPALQGGGALPALRGGAVPHAPGASARTFGNQIAQAVYEGIGKK